MTERVENMKKYVKNMKEYTLLYRLALERGKIPSLGLPFLYRVWDLEIFRVFVLYRLWPDR